VTTWLLIALVADAQLALLLGAFLAGSLRRWNLIWAACLASMALAVFLLLLLSSAEAVLSVFSFNPAKVVQEVIKSSDYRVVVKGFLLGVPGPVLTLGILAVVLRHRQRWLGPASTAVMGSILLALILGIIITAPPATQPHLDVSSVTIVRQDRSEKLILPPGFQAKAYLPTGINKITSIAFDSRDRLYVASQDGVVATVDDTDADGVGDQLRFFASKDGLILGIAISEDDETVYLAGGGEVLKVEDNDLDGRADSSQRIIRGLPSFVYSVHSNNGLVIGPDGRLYVTLGGTSNTGPENHPLAGSILTANTDGSELKVYARGMRNPYDLVFTSSGLLVATDNGPELEEGTPVPDEVNVVIANGHYGYPDYFGLPPNGSGTIAPVSLLPEHSVPTGIVEYTSAGFPAKFHGRLFLTYFGVQVESKVVTITLTAPKSGEIQAVVEDFALGFSHVIDVAVDSKGLLYVADYGDGQVYRISWEGTSP